MGLLCYANRKREKQISVGGRGGEERKRGGETPATYQLVWTCHCTAETCYCTRGRLGCVCRPRKYISGGLRRSFEISHGSHFVMAETQTTQKTTKVYRKITKIPVLSTEYNKTLREVKQKKLAAEVKEGEIALLKGDLKSLREKKTAAAEETENVSPPTTTTPTKMLPPASSQGSVRSIIYTPKGTKRKGMILHRCSDFLLGTFCLCCVEYSIRISTLFFRSLRFHS